MFKLESYITPIILSYVNRYINNFRPEDSQVSLWGGDATFHNLELNLEVLEQELQLPFSFVSGSIRELSIHVPWTKIASEPIKITINTIECILNLKGRGSRQTPQKKKPKEKVAGQSKTVEAPPGYIQSLINKIVSNISIHCNNLILKYVEEDIVLSMNVKLLKFESADEKWNSAYTDLSPAQVILRKVISVNDLTLCLDKRNASGKIEVYQEPMLYRCSMTMHLLRHYHSATANMASTTRLDVYCNNMEFSMTEQQVPMLMRLLMLLYALQQKQLKPENGSTTDGAGSTSDNKGENQESGETWTGWAWSYVSSVLPAPWEDEWDNEELKSHRGHTLQFGLYVDRASVTFKVSDSNNERGYYGQKKLRYFPMLTLDLQGIYIDTVIHGMTWFNCTGGVSRATMTPVGYCSCGHVEVEDRSESYLTSGSSSNFHKSDSLFDAEAIENKGGRRQYNTSWEYHMITTTESVLLERTPAFAFDYAYQVEIPDDMSSEVLSEMGSNYEFSNLAEISALRLCIGPFRLRICSGLFHRLGTLQVASSFYDYPPYFTPKPDLSLQDLLPPSEEDFDALSEFIPTRSIRMTFFAPLIELELMDHPFFQATKGCLFKRNKKQSTSSITATSSSILPKISITCQFIDISQKYPMYVNRLVHTTCQLPEPPKELFEACYTKKNIKIVGLLSRLVTNPACQSIILTPSSMSYSTKSIIKPQYWTSSDIPHDEVVFESESQTLNGTKAKMLVVYNIVEKMLLWEPDPVGKSIYSSSLLTDACRDFGFPYMEICIEGIRFKKVTTNSTRTLDMSIESLKAFIFERVDSKSSLMPTKNSSHSIQQVLFVSGPEPKSDNSKRQSSVSKTSESAELPLLTVTIQFPLSPEQQKHAPILIFNLQEIRICIDPLLCRWLLYVPKNFILNDILDSAAIAKAKTLSEASGSLAETPRKMSSQHLESVHSSSDREHQKRPQKLFTGNAAKEEVVDIQEKVYNKLKTWFDVWKGLLLCGDISQCTIYFPMVSLSAIGSQGIQEAVDQAVNKENPPDIMVITLPFANVRSAHRQNVTKYLKILPVTLPESLWSIDKSSFPWTMSVSELSCYSIQQGNKLIFLKPVSLSATVGLSTRPSKSNLTTDTSETVEKTKETTAQGVKKKSNVPNKDHKMKSSKTTNASVASSSKAHHGKTSDGSTSPNSPKSQNKRVQNKAGQSQNGQNGVTTTKVDIGYLGVCVHIDMTPVVVSTSEVQVYLFASILYGLMEVATNLLPIKTSRSAGSSKVIPLEVVPPIDTNAGSSSMSPTIRRENTLDGVSEQTPPLSAAMDAESISDSDSVKLTAWVQWTITRFTIELLSSELTECKLKESDSLQPRLKLVVDAEDIVSSLDFQSIYLKVKSKIGTASVRHYERASPTSQWQPGPFSGVVMRLRDDLVHSQRQEDNSLISVTITRASCQHTHTLWGAVQKKNKDKKSESNAQILSKSKYITEIVVSIQPLDFIISLNTLRSFYLVLIPLLNIPVNNHKNQKNAESSASNSFLANINNQSLPLAYLDCQDVRIIMPSKDLSDCGMLHDVVVFQLQKISLNPQAVNPICRTPIRADIYDQAAHARILNIPGSEVEDRQYQLDIIGSSVCTGLWEDINSILSPSDSVLSNLRGMSENPALEWNILEQGRPNTIPMMNLKCIVEKFDTTIVAAPSMVYKGNTTVCGHSVEINLVSDIFVNLSLHQIRLLSALMSEFVMLITPLIKEDGVYKRPKITFPYSRFESCLSEIESEKTLTIIEGQHKDSGIETSENKSVQSIKAQGNSLITKLSAESEKQIIFPRPPNTVPYVYSSVPLEVVWTSGKICLSLYSVDDEKNGSVKHKGKKKKATRKADEDQGYEASEESTDEKSDTYKKYIPLLYLRFTQPNAFLARQQLGRKIQVSCFDVSLRLSGPEYPAVNHVPVEIDFPVSLLETKPGSPNPNNGILPAFFTLKFTKGVGKNSKIELEIEKPTKILCKNSKWYQLLTIKDRVVDTFRSGGGSDSFTALIDAMNDAKNGGSKVYPRNSKSSDTYYKFQKIKDFLGSTNSISVNFDQVVLAVASESGHELHFGMRKLKSHLSINTRPEKLCLLTTFDCLTLTVIYDSFKKLLLNPWTATVDVCIFWESWQDSDSDPQVQITAESDCILVDVTSEQIKCVEMILKDVKEFVAMLPRMEKTDDTKNDLSTKFIDRDQHYKDDLRAGAFQFIDSSTDNTDEMPLPYQVMFWTKNISAMAWKYPQPRALTKVRIFPVPYKMALGAPDNILVLCHLEYWSECRNCYLPYTQFYLSESEVCHLNLPKGCPKTVVASTWRVVITIIDEKTEEPITTKGGISARALAACMRIDSYFNRSLIPNLNVALYITKLELSLYNYFPKNLAAKLPDFLGNYCCDMSFPENQKFLTFSLGNVTAYLSSWSFDVVLGEVSSSIQGTVLDYAFLTAQSFVEPFTSKLELCLSNGLRCNYISKPVQVRFGPSIAHTLAVSSQMWTQNFVAGQQELDFVIVSRYIVCNDTNVCLRFGQSGTEEDVLVPSRGFHLYSWRSQRRKQQLRLALEENEWVWSKSFSVFDEGTQTIHFGTEKNVTVFVTVKNLSKTQKRVTFYGQLIVCNMLAEHFEMKIIDAGADNKEQEFKNAQNHVAAGRGAAPSMFVNNKKSYFLRLRFYGLEAAWTGDIPLREHATGSQPWLVKVPLQERGQFLSIWCKIFVQEVGRSNRIVAMLWPLFMVKSNLPIGVKIHIETPILGVHLDSVVKGKGELQQLYCPGTIDHSHQITFQLEEGNSNVNNPYVPLNYSLVDQQKFFKRSPKEDVEDILESLNGCFESKWPYFGDEFDNIDWIVDDNQPLTHVQVRYQNACQHSCALLVELMPWCLMVNTLGTAVSLMLNGVELCRIQHHSIMAPPRLEENFHLGVCTGNNWFFSGPLQLAKSDWTQSFYMPKISGNIPLEGTIRTCVKCDSHLCMISITSSLSNEIRLLRLSSTHILSNHLSSQVHVMCFAVPDGRGVYEMPPDVDKYCFTVAPHLQKSHSGVPIIQWYMLKQESESSSDYNLYMMLSADPALGWSCPIRLDKPLARKALSIQTKDLSIPVVLTCQEVKGQIYLSIHNDPRPQIFIENKTNVPFYCGQSLPDDSGVVKESEHFRWNCKIASFSSHFYNMPVISDNFPELPQAYFSEKISLAYDNSQDKNSLEWSAGVSIVNNNDLFIRVPCYGDVKLTIVNTACTTFLIIESVSQVEISARDIRVRLSMREQEKVPALYKANRELESFIKNTSIDTSDDVDSCILSPISTTSSINVPPSFQRLPTVAEQLNSDRIVPKLNLNSPRFSRSFSDETPLILSKTKSLLVETLTLHDGWESININVFVKSFGFTLITDMEEDGEERWELASFVCDDIILTATQAQNLKVQLSLSDIQLDNQLYTRESFDFPVVLIGQDRKPSRKLNILSVPIETLIENSQGNSLVIVDLVLESWRNESANKSYTGIKMMKIAVSPISSYIEDIYVTRLMQYFKNFHLIDLVMWPQFRPHVKLGASSTAINVPELVSWQCAILAQPLTIRTFVVSPVSMLLSVHSSMKLYIALDQSPLHFARFERRRLFTTPYRLGHALTMHYLSGAIFGAGWVVSSLELLGSPGGLARAMGTGLRDFVSLPYRGLVQGPMAFLKGITTGSASLMRHVTAGTLQSVTKLASSVARNLDRLTLDEEHQKRTEEQRRQRPQGVAQGFMQGMTSFGISLLGAVGGIAHHPLQSMMTTGASPRSLAAGVGLGIVGVFTKPLSGAAELVALTGQGLLQGAGWNSLPDPRSLPQTVKIHHSTNSTLKYPWKLINLLHAQMLYVTEATSISPTSIYASVALILTADNIILIDIENDEVSKVIALTEVSIVENNDPTVLTLKHMPSNIVQKASEQVEDEMEISMDPGVRARVANYVQSTIGLLNLPKGSSMHSEISVSPLSSPGIEERSAEQGNTTMNFYVSSHNMRYFTCLLNLAKQQSAGNHFTVL